MGKTDPSLKKLKRNLAKSPFSAEIGRVDESLFGFLDSILTVTNRKSLMDLRCTNSVSGVKQVKLACDLVLSAVPKFQRDADKWTLIKQQAFLLNLLMGHSPEISLYRTSQIGDFKIIDGLQRLSAILKLFLEPDFLIPIDHSFSDFVKARDIISDTGLIMTTNIVFKKYFFNSELEAVNFYISSNMGFTHSEEDIERAVTYRNSIS